jgi:hypothetical protein
MWNGRLCLYPACPAVSASLCRRCSFADVLSRESTCAAHLPISDCRNFLPAFSCVSLFLDTTSHLPLCTAGPARSHVQRPTLRLPCLSQCECVFFSPLLLRSSSLANAPALQTWPACPCASNRISTSPNRRANVSLCFLTDACVWSALLSLPRVPSLLRTSRSPNDRANHCVCFQCDALSPSRATSPSHIPLAQQPCKSLRLFSMRRPWFNARLRVSPV